MKKIFYLLIAAFAFIVVPIAIFGQDTPPPGGGVTVLPIVPLSFDLGSYVVTFLTFAATVIFLTSLLNKFITLKGFAKQYLSWGVAVVVGLLAFLLHLGIFATVQWWGAIIFAVMAGLGANGIFDWQLIQAILRAIHLEPPLEPPAEVPLKYNTR